MAAIASRLILLIFVISIVQCRILSLNSFDNNLVSDGTDRVQNLPSSLGEENTCNHQYGFLPCAENTGGYVFQILVYQGLLVYGGNLIGKGSTVLFDITGVGKIGGIIFRILMSLPSMILMIGSGVGGSKESAQSKVSVGVGIYAGITVFSLTLQWAICVIYGRKELTQNGTYRQTQTKESNSNCLPAEKAITVLKDTGVTLDMQTQTTAGIMLLSLIPYIIVQLNVILNTSTGIRIVTLIALIVSSFSLIAYFGFQILNPWIQERTLNYSKHELLRNEFLEHIQRQGKLVNENGELNTDVVKKLFDDVDKDDDNCVTYGEMEKLVNEIISIGQVNVDKKFAVDEIMKTFDFDNNKDIDEEEFINGCKQWIEETRKASKKGDSSRNTTTSKKKDRVMAKIIKHAETEVLKSQALVTPDGKPNEEQIKALFRQLDSDGDKTISRSELEQLLKTINFGESRLIYEDVVKDMFKEFDVDNNNAIDEPEFLAGLEKWVDTAIIVAKDGDKTKSIDEYHKLVWTSEKYNSWDFYTSVFNILFGIAILTFLGGPLMTNILQLSFAMNLPSFCISFVIVPLATNAIGAIKAILPSKQKSEFLASLTFSEIYSGVIMNNVAGMTALLAIVYAKGLTFDFSAEVMTILVVCGIIGGIAYSRRSYPLWTCLLAFFLYPFSLGLFYFFHFFLSWS